MASKGLWRHGTYYADHACMTSRVFVPLTVTIRALSEAQTLASSRFGPERGHVTNGCCVNHGILDSNDYVLPACQLSRPKTLLVIEVANLFSCTCHQGPAGHKRFGVLASTLPTPTRSKCCRAMVTSTMFDCWRCRYRFLCACPLVPATYSCVVMYVTLASCHSHH